MFNTHTIFKLMLALLACITIAQASDETAVTYRLDPESDWTIAVDVATGTIVCQHADHPQDSFELDYDDTSSDGRYPGIYPTVNGIDMSGHFFYGESGLITAPFSSSASAAKAITDLFEIEFSSPEDVLRLRLEGESYQQLNQAAGGAPLYTEAAIYYSDDELHIDLYGLYYLLPNLTDTQVTLTDVDGQTINRSVTTDSEAVIEYYPNITKVEINDSVFGDYSFETYCQRLQLQIQNPNSYPGAGFEVFEFDFDHSFKDRGQRSVMTELVIPLN